MSIEIAKIIEKLNSVYRSDALGNEPSWFTDDDDIEGASGRIYKLGDITNREYWEDVCGSHLSDDDETADEKISGEFYGDMLYRNTADVDEMIEMLEHDINYNPGPFPIAKKIMSEAYDMLNAIIEHAEEAE